MKTSQLSGRALQHAVMLAEGWTYFQSTPEQCAVYGRNSGPTQTWTVAGPDFLTGRAGDDIIDRECISSQYESDQLWNAHLGWNGYTLQPMFWASGTTRREAAMRAYVASKLGDEIELPQEFK